MGILEYYDYPFEEFCNHFNALSIIRDYDTVRLDYTVDRDPIYVGDDRDIEAI